MSTTPLPSLDGVDTWLFDLDNTLYPANCNIFPLVERRMGLFIEERFGMEREAARALQKRLFGQYGTTMRGLMTEKGVDAEEYLAFVHDIDLATLVPDQVLLEAVARLPGRKLIFTNASAEHALRVLERVSLAGHFEAVFDIRDAAFDPKPGEAAYDLLIERHGIDPWRTVFFEDTVRNLQPAHARGMTTVWVEHDAVWSRADMAGVGDQTPDYVHHRTRELPAWLAALG